MFNFSFNVCTNCCEKYDNLGYNFNILINLGCKILGNVGYGCELCKNVDINVKYGEIQGIIPRYVEMWDEIEGSVKVNTIVKHGEI